MPARKHDSYWKDSIVKQIMCPELPEASRILITTDDFSAKVRYVGTILAIDCIVLIIKKDSELMR